MKRIIYMLALVSLTACNQYPVVGATGATGATGAGCTVTNVPAGAVAPNGGAVVACGSTQQLILNGTNGVNGTNGTVINAVQFCPNVTSYPGTFSEVGFCIDNELYAVYSANDGFLSALPNGQYSSDGINSSCTFTVTGCTVSH